jgi:hypothetical protein
VRWDQISTAIRGLVQAGPREVNGLRLGYQCSLTATAMGMYAILTWCMQKELSG